MLFTDTVKRVGWESPNMPHETPFLSEGIVLEQNSWRLQGMHQPRVVLGVCEKWCGCG